jgi:hypothetical protein
MTPPNVSMLTQHYIDALKNYAKEKEWFAGKKLIKVLATMALINAEGLIMFLRVVDETHMLYWEWTYLMVLYVGSICLHSNISSIRKLAFRDTTLVGATELHGLMYFANYKHEFHQTTASSWKIRTSAALCLLEIVRRQSQGYMYSTAYSLLQERKSNEAEPRLKDIIKKGLVELTIMKTTQPTKVEKKPRLSPRTWELSEGETDDQSSYFSFLFFSITIETAKLIVESQYSESIVAKFIGGFKPKSSPRVYQTGRGRITPPNSQSQQLPRLSRLSGLSGISKSPPSSTGDVSVPELSVEPYHRNYMALMSPTKRTPSSKVTELGPSSLQRMLHNNGGDAQLSKDEKPLYSLQQPGSLNRRKLYVAPHTKGFLFIQPGKSKQKESRDKGESSVHVSCIL